MTGRGAREVGDGADMWAQAVSGERRREGAAATVACLDWAGLGRKRGRGKEGGVRVGGKEMASRPSQAESEEGREKRKKFLFFFQINFPNSFSS